MQNGICPNCQARTVYMLENGVQVGETNGMYVLAGKQRRMSSVNCYVCTTCGYMQYYLLDPQILKEIAEFGRWIPVKSST